MWVPRYTLYWIHIHVATKHTPVRSGVQAIHACNCKVILLEQNLPLNTRANID